MTIAALAILFVAVAAQAQMPQPFSADFSASTAKHAGDMTGKFYFSAPKSRMDMTSRGQNMSMITDGTVPVSYMIMHQQHMYMEIKPGQFNPMTRNLPQVESKFDPHSPCASGLHSDATCKQLGTETVNGRVCDKWQSTQKNGNTTTMWVDQKLHFPIKSVNSDGSVFEFTNIKEGAQPASQFELPSGYRKMDMGSMMGGMGGKPE